ncbi:MAG: hypothetical protein RBS56_03330 [Candidatus Gracilibacteria bacterium]|jgi:hypothetical protein|nr:hypothetical protein [Candidatus Gracilibacteria bacterium]
MLKFIVLILGTAVSLAILKFRLEVKNMLGDIAFAEKYFGTGGTHFLVIIIGIVIFVFSLMYATGTLQSLFKGPLALLFGL